MGGQQQQEEEETGQAGEESSFTEDSHGLEAPGEEGLHNPPLSAAESGLCFWL